MPVEKRNISRVGSSDIVDENEYMVRGLTKTRSAYWVQTRDGWVKIIRRKGGFTATRSAGGPVGMYSISTIQMSAADLVMLAETFCTHYFLASDVDVTVTGEWKPPSALSQMIDEIVKGFMCDSAETPQR